MYKQPIGVISVVLNLFLFSAFAQSPISNEEQFIEKHKYDVVQIDCKRVPDYALSKVFTNPIYHLRVTTKQGFGQQGFGQMPFGNFLVARVGDELVPIPRPAPDGSYSDLVPMIRSDFKLTSDDDAEILQRALDLILPTIPQEDGWEEHFRHDGDQWTFVRGRALGIGSPRKGEIVVTTGSKGTITGVRYLP